MTYNCTELPTRRDNPGKPTNPDEDPVVPPDRKQPPVEEPPKRRDAPEPPEIEDPRPPKPKKITRDD